MTATLERMRRCSRESEFATVRNDAVRAGRPDARPIGEDDYTIDSFFDYTAHGQALLEQRFAIQSASRRSEAADCETPLRIGIDIPIVPKLPHARMIDPTRMLDRSMLMKGFAIDMNAERNSVEAIG